MADNKSSYDETFEDDVHALVSAILTLRDQESAGRAQEAISDILDREAEARDEGMSEYADGFFHAAQIFGDYFGIKVTLEEDEEPEFVMYDGDGGGELEESESSRSELVLR